MASVFPLLHESLRDVLSTRLNWNDLREIQEHTFVAVSQGRHTLVIAPTAGGKTEAALIPVVNEIMRTGGTGVACIIISPLKALINDQEERVNAFCAPLGIDVQKWHGDVPRHERGWEQGEAPLVLMITPESLEVLLFEDHLAIDLRSVKFVIVDELHAFVETPRGVQLLALLDRITRSCAQPPCRIGLSATVGNPEGVISWLTGGKGAAGVVQVPALPKPRQFSFHMAEEEGDVPDTIARVVRGRKALVFANSRSEAESLAVQFPPNIGSCAVHHSSLAPALRKAAEEGFRSGEHTCIIATGTLELGIDIGDLDLVVQLGAPPSVSSFLQRMGRAGRRGETPHLASVLRSPCELLFLIGAIEAAQGKEVEWLNPPTAPYDVLVQQAFLLIVRRGRIARNRVVRDVLSLAPFRGISPGTLQRILDYAIERGVLISDEGVLMIGGALEEQLGIANWKDLFSLIPGGNQVPVMTSDGEEVGRLDVRFVQGRGGRGFPLGGQGWELTGVQQGSDSLTIVPAGALTGGVFWRGGGDVVSPLICRAVLRIVVRGGTLLPLGATCRDALSRAIKTLPSAMEEGQITCREEPTKNGPSIRVYTFQGARFNRVLALMIGDLLGKKVKVRYGGIAVVVHGRLGDDAVNRVAEAVAGCKSMSIGEVRAILPPPPRGTWKFSDLLPDEVREEMACADFYHLSNFAQTLRSLVVRTAEAVYSDADEPPRSLGPRPGQGEQA